MTLIRRVARLEQVANRRSHPDGLGRTGRELAGEQEPWLQALFPEHISRDDGSFIPLAEHHHEFWRWVWALERGVKPRPLVCLWPRGGGKSSSVEMSIVAVGARKVRTYVLYVCGTQDQADDHVANIASLLESDTVADYYPDLSERAVSKFGPPKGWRRNRLWTRAGLIVDALGLDVAARGVKLGKQRPDLIVFDDVDDEKDSMPTVEKKVNSITKKLLPAGSSDSAVMFVQNVVHHQSVAARLAGIASVTADFLGNRIVSGPLPALRGYEVEKQPDGMWKIVRGEPIWEGQNLAICQGQLIEWGKRAFEAEALHRQVPPEGQAFPEFDVSVHVVQPSKIPETWPRWRAIDYGYAVPYCCLWMTRSPSGKIIVYREDYGAGMTAGAQALRVRMLSAGERYFTSVADPAMWAENREGERFKSNAAQYAEMGIELLKASNNRIAGWDRLHQMFDWSEEAPPTIEISAACTNLIRTLPLLKKDPNKPDDVDSHVDQEDHAADALRYGVMAAHWLETAKRQKPQSYRVGVVRRAG